MRMSMIAFTVLLAANYATAAKPPDPGRELRDHLRGTKWQWDGGGGEAVTFADNGYVENVGWGKRGLITRWTVIDKRTVLLRIERGRTRDLHAVLMFNRRMTSYDAFNFHGGARLQTSKRWSKADTGPTKSMYRYKSIRADED